MKPYENSVAHRGPANRATLRRNADPKPDGGDAGSRDPVKALWAAYDSLLPGGHQFYTFDGPTVMLFQIPK